MNTFAQILALVAIILSILDVTSTIKGWSVGLTEMNPAMRWVQKVLPKYWVEVRIGAGMVIAIGALLLPLFSSIVVLLIVNGLQGWTVYNNYRQIYSK